MFTDKYFKTDSRVILVGKQFVGVDNGLEQVIEGGEFTVLHTDLSEVTPLLGIVYLRGVLEGMHMVSPRNPRVVVLISNIESLDETESSFFSTTVDEWVKRSVVSFVCTGEESVLSRTFRTPGFKYFDLDSESADAFKLISKTGEVISICKE